MIFPCEIKPLRPKESVLSKMKTQSEIHSENNLQGLNSLEFPDAVREKSEIESNVTTKTFIEIAAVSFSLIFVFLIFKQLVSPEISNWISNIMTAVFSTAVALGGALYVLRFNRIRRDAGKFEIKERERIEEALRESENRFRDLFENANDILYTTDLTGNFTALNRAGEKITGYTREEALKMNIGQVVAPEFLDLAEKMIKLKLEGKSSTVYELEIISKHGGRVLLEVSTNIVERDGKAVEIQGRARDISESRGAEAALRESEERFRSFYENAPIGIYRTSREGQFLMVNPTLLKMLNMTFGELGKFDLNDKNRWNYSRKKFVEEIERDGEIRGLETVWKKKDGTSVYMRENARCVRDKDGKVLYYEGTLEDITDRKLLEEKLLQSQKMDAIGQLAGGIAHDFNNVLTIINGYSELALSRLPEGDKLRRNLEEIKKAGKRAASLTRQLLAFSRKQMLEPKTLDLNLIVADMDRMLRRLIGEDIDFVTVLKPRLGSVKADPGQIEQVIMNLVVNARDAMPRGGKLTIETADIYLDENYARRHDSITPGNYVMLAVSDTGIGMDAETTQRIFEPFFTTKEKGKGTGLGLSTVYGIVRQSGGNIWVYSEIGIGTTFKIYLPLVDEAANFSKQEFAFFDLPEGDETILLVEDENAVRDLVGDILKTHGYTVLIAENGASALKIGKQHKGKIDLMVTDVVMPQMSGRDLVENLAPFRPEMKVLYMSGYTNNAIVHHGVLDNGTYFIQKPFAPQSFARKVRETLDSPVVSSES